MTNSSICRFVFFLSILDHEPGEKVPMIVQQTIDFIKNYGMKSIRNFIARETFFCVQDSMNRESYVKVHRLNQSNTCKTDTMQVRGIDKWMKSMDSFSSRSTGSLCTTQWSSSRCMYLENLLAWFNWTIVYFSIVSWNSQSSQRWVGVVDSTAMWYRWYFQDWNELNNWMRFGILSMIVYPTKIITFSNIWLTSSI